ncbi:MAG: hypothetical protein PIR53_20275 [Nocardioides alkalitolerans]
MRIVSDHGEVPARTVLEETGSFDAFSIEIRVPSHTWVDRDILCELAGDAVDRAWLDRLDTMVAYAERQGWVDDRGRIRAHLEVVQADVVAQAGSGTD